MEPGPTGLHRYSSSVSDHLNADHERPLADSGLRVWGRANRRVVLLLLLGGAVAFQIAQGLAYQRRITPYKASYWLVTYEFGFTRRGLAGEMLRRLAGTSPSLVAIEVAQYALTAVILTLLLLLIRALWRRDNRAGDLAALALCCSPFVLDFAVFQRRPDQIGYASVILFGFLLYRMPQQRTLVAAAGGALLTISVAVSDSSFLACVGWVLLIAILAPGENLRNLRTWSRLLLIALPPAIMAIVSATAGRLDHSQAQQLASTASKYGWTDVVVFPYLTDTLRESVNRVGDMPQTMMLGSLAIGLVLLLLQGWLMLGLRVPTPTAASGIRFAPALAVAMCAIGLVALLALGIDWFRWISGFGFMSTTAVAFGVLLRPSERGPANRALATPATILVSAYLLAVAAFPNMISLSEGFLQLLLAYNSAGP